MNLIQIQEHLKDLPTQAIMSYANGQNPQVPPYMALGEMNRRKTMEQRAAQAPDSSVKEKLESELAQQTALPGIGQGMNLRTNPAGMPQPMPAAQPQMAPKMPGMPVPPMAQKMPPQQMSQPGAAPGMAGGGLAELPVRSDMFNYAPGGIVAFADKGVVPPPELPESDAINILKSRMTGDSGVEEIKNPEDIRAKFIAEHPEQAKLLSSMPGEALTRLASNLEQQNAAQKEQFQQGEGTRGLAALSNALIAAGEATRGQKGSGIGSAFGGFGKAYNASTAEAEDRAAKQQATERAQTIETIKLQSDVENLQRAYAEGNVAKIAEYEKAVRDRKNTIAGLQAGAAKDITSMAEQRRQHEETGRHNQALETQAKRNADAAAESARYAREARPSAEDKKMDRVMARVNGDPAIRALADQIKMADPNSDEYYNLVEKIQALAGPYYASAGIEPPTSVKRTGPPQAPPKKGFFASLFGESSTPAKPTAVPFDQLPK
jgi:hypothetical protein